VAVRDQLRTGMRALLASDALAQVARESGPNPVVTRLEQRIPELMRAGDVSGLPIAVIQDGREVWRHGCGVVSAAT
jgi:CubicO group peptidase (beta-lactamase class C family)